MYRLLMIPGLLRSVSDFLYANRAKVYNVIVISALVAALLLSLFHIKKLNEEAALYEEQISSMNSRLSAYDDMARKKETPGEEVSALQAKVRVLEEEQEEPENVSDEPEDDLLVPWEHGGEQLTETQWIEEAEKRPQPGDVFKITFYSTQGVYEHLIPGKTVAMNSQQVADLGLKRGDEIYVKSNKGWSGFYTITDSGCAYGIIDIYVSPGGVPSYGVEYNVTILI